MSEEIRVRLAAGGRSYMALLGVLKSRNVSRNTKKRIYRTVIRPVVTYGAETWTLTGKEAEVLERWERRVLRRIYGPVMEGKNKCRIGRFIWRAKYSSGSKGE